MYNFLSLIRFILFLVIQSFFSEHFYEVHIYIVLRKRYVWALNSLRRHRALMVWLKCLGMTMHLIIYCIPTNYFYFKRVLNIQEKISLFHNKKKTLSLRVLIYTVWTNATSNKNLTKEIGDLRHFFSDCPNDWQHSKIKIA